MTEDTLLEAGELVARILAGAWRSSPPPVDLSPEDLERIAPLLHLSGAAALGWWRVRGSPLEGTPAASDLRQAFRLRVLEAAVEHGAVARAFRILRGEGVEPILGKGWAAARLYPDEAFRPYCDIDLCVRPADHRAAETLLPDLAREGCSVDLHRGFPQLSDRPLEALYERSEIVPLEGVDVRFLGPEDHLRLLSLHMLGHGAWRPLWLCDLGAALESRPPGFDWSWFLGGDARRTDWVVCALGLAHALLRARLDGASVPTRRLPRWLLPALLRQWGRIGPETPQGARTPMSAYLHNPSGALRALRIRWPNPIEATVGIGGSFNELPRWPFQVGASLWRTLRFASRIPAVLRERR